MKKLLIVPCLLLLLVGCTKNEEPVNNDTSDKLTNNVTLNGLVHYDNNVAQESALKSLTISDFEYSDFSIQVMGLFQGVINREILKDVTKYSYSLNTIYNEKNLELSYEGVYFRNVMNALDAGEYTKVMFTDKQGNTVTVRKEDIKDALLIFRSNEHYLNEWGPAKVVVTTYNMETWLESVISVTFK